MNRSWIALAAAALAVPALAQADNLVGAGLGVNFSSLTNQTGASGNTEFVGGVFGD